MLCIIFGEIPEDMEKKYVYNTSMYLTIPILITGLPTTFRLK